MPCGSAGRRRSSLAPGSVRARGRRRRRLHRARSWPTRAASRGPGPSTATPRPSAERPAADRPAGRRRAARPADRVVVLHRPPARRLGRPLRLRVRHLPRRAGHVPGDLGVAPGDHRRGAAGRSTTPSGARSGRRSTSRRRCRAGRRRSPWRSRGSSPARRPRRGRRGSMRGERRTRPAGRRGSTGRGGRGWVAGRAGLDLDARDRRSRRSSTTTTAGSTSGRPAARTTTRGPRWTATGTIDVDGRHARRSTGNGLVRPPVGRLHRGRRRRLGLVRGQPRRRHRPDALAGPRGRRVLPAGLRHARRRDGTARSLDRTAFTVTPTGRWRSPGTGADLPGRLARSSIPGERLRIELTPTVADQELDTRATTGVVYWEGSQIVTGDPGRGRRSAARRTSS